MKRSFVILIYHMRPGFFFCHLLAVLHSLVKG
nr:MAG TPA: hypothetical protein [Caudoviricetes sp.]